MAEDRGHAFFAVHEGDVVVSTDPVTESHVELISGSVVSSVSNSPIHKESLVLSALEKGGCCSTSGNQGNSKGFHI